MVKHTSSDNQYLTYKNPCPIHLCVKYLTNGALVIWENCYSVRRKHGVFCQFARTLLRFFRCRAVGTLENLQPIVIAISPAPPQVGIFAMTTDVLKSYIRSQRSLYNIVAIGGCGIYPAAIYMSTVKKIPASENGFGVECVTKSRSKFHITQNLTTCKHTLLNVSPVGYYKKSPQAIPLAICTWNLVRWIHLW